MEIPALDLKVSADFYATVFNWRIRTRNDGSTAFDDGVGEVSGTWVTNKKAVADSGYMVHIMVDDIEATMAMVKSNGGKITQEVGADAPEITTKFSDPAGNIFGLYQEPA
ncbi:MAG: VOC family protein [Ferruginibacter sp.]|nr:VOC family protein [Ferruginibacter sp.]